MHDISTHYVYLSTIYYFALVNGFKISFNVKTTWLHIRDEFQKNKDWQ